VQVGKARQYRLSRSSNGSYSRLVLELKLQMFHFANIVTISLTLFAVIDILGSIPAIIDLRTKAGDIPALKATLVSGGIMVGFFFIGDQLLNLIGIDISSFAIAGAVVIFIVALEMILDREFFKQHSNPLTGAIVPLAFPLIAGAGTLTTLVSLKANFTTADILVSVFVNLVFVYTVLKTTHLIERLLRPSGIAILRRVFGIILMAIAIKIVSSNIGKVLHPDAPPTASAPAQVEGLGLPS
jgi:multiple antibiotic resistance protein